MRPPAVPPARTEHCCQCVYERGGNCWHAFDAQRFCPKHEVFGRRV